MSRRPRGLSPGERALWETYAKRYRAKAARPPARAGAPSETPPAPPASPAPVARAPGTESDAAPGGLAPFRLGERARAMGGTAGPPGTGPEGAATAATAPPVTIDRAPPLGEALAAAPGGARGGADWRARRALARGRARPEARLDLHGLTLDRAHPALTGFVRRAHAEGLRLVLVITGKGRPDDGAEVIARPRGLLRHQVPAWLAQPPLAGMVQGVAPAHRRHGGEGAYYVTLRRRR